MRKWIAAALLILGATTIPFTTSVAQAPDAQGWWWQYRQAELPVDPKGVVPQYPGTPELPPPASVPEDGLYVAGSAAGPEAISALSFVIAENSIAKSLTLIAAAPLTPTTSIRLCPTNTTWQPVQAGRWSSKPLYECADDAPVGVVPTDGSKITFTLGKMGESRLIDVVLVSTDQAVFQANFAKPDDKALEVISAASSDAAGSGAGGSILGTEQSPNSLNYAVTDPAYTPALEPYLQPGADGAVGSAPLIEYPPQRNALPAGAQTGADDNLETFGIFGLIALAALFSRYRSQPAREPKSLVNFGKHRDAEVS